MQWMKQGILFRPDGHGEWMNSHAQVPTALVKEKEGIVRVYFAARERQDLSQTSYVDLNMNDLTKVRYINPEPLLDLGGPGTFDEFGIMPASVHWQGNTDQVFLYYSGWSRSYTLPYSNYTGLAISDDGGRSFHKHSPGPIVDRTPWELYSATSPAVYRQSESSWHMFYCSGTGWHKVNERWEHTYDIKYASSSDGKTWRQGNRTIIAAHDEFEALTRPTVICKDDQYHMWYCYRGSRDFRDGRESYRIGYAVSDDIVNWRRCDQASGISPSDEGWDSLMMAYPNVVRIQDEWVMFYNGNSFGKEGFGYAVLDWK